MSKVTIGILLAAVVLIVVAVFFEVSFVAGGSGVVLVVALGYSYVVAKREVELLSYAINERESQSGNQPGQSGGLTD